MCTERGALEPGFLVTPHTHTERKDSPRAEGKARCIWPEGQGRVGQKQPGLTFPVVPEGVQVSGRPLLREHDAVGGAGASHFTSRSIFRRLLPCEGSQRGLCGFPLWPPQTPLFPVDDLMALAGESIHVNPDSGIWGSREDLCPLCPLLPTARKTLGVLPAGAA